MSFGEAIGTCYKKYATFKGRASRSEFWWFGLYLWCISMVATIIDVIFRLHFVLYLIVFLIHFIPALSVCVRRLHDIDKSGWWIFIGMIPFIGPILVFIWQCTKGSLGENRFGEDPLKQDNQKSNSI